MANTIQINRSTTAGNVPSLDAGELGVNLTDNTLYVGQDANTKLLIHGGGADGTQAFTDASPSGHTISYFGNTQWDDAQSKFASTSIKFDGNGDELSIEAHADFSWPAPSGSANDFTIDFWHKRTGTQTWSSFLSTYHPSYGGVGGSGFIFGCNADTNTLAWYNGAWFHASGTEGQAGSATVINTTDWYHIAAVRSGNTTTFYVNGVVEFSLTDNDSYDSTYGGNGKLWVGSRGGGNQEIVGYLEEIRISKGIARWTAAFTPPTRRYGVMSPEPTGDHLPLSGGTLTGGLTGTTATFSSDVTIGSGGSTPDLTFAEGNSSIYGPLNANFLIKSRGNDAAEGISLQGADGVGLDINKAGAATFSGALTVGGQAYINTAGNTSNGTYYSTVTINNTGTSSWSRLRFDRGGVAKWGIALGTDDKFRISNLYTSGSTANPDDNTLVISNDNSISLSGALTVGGNINKTGDLTLDSSGNIVLDADGGGVYFKDAGVNIGFLQNSGANDFRLVAGQQDKDIVFMGNDGGSSITALTLDMSEAGDAFFNADIRVLDNRKIRLGTGQDFLLWHDGSANILQVLTQDQDMVFKGNDGGSTITALTLDMSAGGAATFSGALTVSGTANLNGAVMIDGGNGYFVDGVGNSYNTGWDSTSDAHSTWINFYGYQGGTTKFRDLRIGDGKNGLVALFDGSSKAATFSGNVSLQGSGGDVKFTLDRTDKRTYSIYTESNNEFRIRDEDASADRFWISSAGAATFSGTVNAESGTFTGANTNAATYATFKRSDAAVSARIRYDGVSTILIGTSTNHPISFETNATPRLTISAAGVSTFSGTVTGAFNGTLGATSPATVAATTVNASGHIAIGTAPNAWWASMKAVEITAISGGVFASDAVNGHFLTNGYYNGTNWIYSNTGAASYYSQGAAAHKWETAATGTAGNPITWVERATLNATGLAVVGATTSTGGFDGTLGATTPATVAATTVSASGRVDLSGGAFAVLSPTTGGMYVGATPGLVIQGSGTSSDVLILDKSGDDRLAISSTGLAVTGAVTASGAVTVGANVETGVTTENALTQWSATANEGDLDYSVSLHDIRAQAVGTGAGIRFSGRYVDSGSGNAGAGGIDTYKETAVSGEYGFGMRFHTRPDAGSITEQMRIDSAGKVGIGTDTPTSGFKLDVNGYTRTSLLTLRTSAAGVGGTVADENSYELGPGYLNLSRDDTAAARQIQFGKNGSLHSGIMTDTNGLNFVGSDGAADVTIKTNGNVGIGTDTPDVQLVVHEASSGSAWLKFGNSTRTSGMLVGMDSAELQQIYVYGGNPFTIWTDDTERFRVSSDGNVGVGITPSGYLTSGYVMRLYGGGQTYLSFNNSTHTTQVLGGFVIGNDAGAARITQRENQPIIFATNDTDRLTISAAGVSTFTGSITVPSENNAAHPEIAFGDGDTGFYEASDDSMWYASAGVARWKSDSGYLLSTITTFKPTIVNEVATATNPAYTFYTDLDTGIGHAAADKLSLVAGGVGTATVTSTGVGIGTDTPGAKTHIVGAANALALKVTNNAVDGNTSDVVHIEPSNGAYYGNHVRIQNGRSDFSSSLLMLNSTGSGTINATNGSYLRIQDKDSNDVFRITGSGKVGIGVASPDRKFHVVGTDEVARFTGTDANPPTIEFENSTGVQAKIGLKVGHDFIIDTAGEDILMGATATEFTIKADGGVAIGATAAAPWKLYVNGITKINGALEVNGQFSPSANDTYNLGNSTNSWKNLYISDSISCATFSSSGASVVGGTLSGAAATFSGNLTVGGVLGGTSAAFSGAVTASAGCDVATVANTNLRVNGATHAGETWDGAVHLKNSSNIGDETANEAVLYADGGELKCQDDNRNRTTLSSHIDGKWVYKSNNTKTGKSVEIHMEDLVKAVEEHLGVSFSEIVEGNN